MLSLHGYAVRWNQFVGQCPGSKHKPYELSCGLIERFIKNAKEQRAAVQDRIGKLNEPATEPKAWIHEYISTNRQFRSQYEDREATIFESMDGEFKTLYFFDQRGRREPLFTHSIYAKDPLEAATEMNRKFAENQLQPIIKQLTEYIRWQQKRVTDWKLSPLRDLKEVR